MHATLRRYTDLLGAYLTPQWSKVLVLTVLVLSTIGLQLLNPQIIRYFIDTAQQHGTPTHLVLAALTFVGEDVGWTATNQLRADLMLHCLRLDMAFHHERTPGQMIERIDGDVANL